MGLPRRPRGWKRLRKPRGVVYPFDDLAGLPRKPRRWKSLRNLRVSYPLLIVLWAFPRGAGLKKPEKT